jgi:S1-C subfamily serine protease
MVAPGSTAAAMGIKAGDILLSLDDQPIKRDVEVRAFIDRKQWGDAITAKVTRGTETLTLTGRLRRQ